MLRVIATQISSFISANFPPLGILFHSGGNEIGRLWKMKRSKSNLQSGFNRSREFNSNLNFQIKFNRILLVSKTRYLVVTALLLFSFSYCMGNLSLASNEINVYGENYGSSSDFFEGYNLFILERKDASTGVIIDRKIVMTDMSNTIIKEKSIPSTSALADIEFYNTTTVIFGDSESTKMWNFETDVIVDLGFGGHHDLEINYINNTILTLGIESVEIEGQTYVFDLINEYSFNGTLIRSISTQDFVETTWICPFENVVNVSIDLTHANSICYDEEENMIYINCRNTNTFHKIDYKTGEEIWGLGEYGDFTMYNIYGQERDYLFFHPHSLEKIAGNKFLLFDNDFHNQTNAINKQSRLIEISVDETNMVAEITREWKSPIEYWSPIWGDCDLLPNGNLLGVFGYTTDMGLETGSKLVEVNKKGEITWLVESPLEENILFKIYKIERFRFAPIVSEPTITQTDDTVKFEWNVWHNFKSNTIFRGKYNIYLDDQLLISGNVDCPRYWEPLAVSYSLTDLTEDIHDISIIVEDERGQLSSDSEFYEGSFKFNLQTDLNTITPLSLGISIPILTAVSITFIFYVKRK